MSRYLQSLGLYLTEVAPYDEKAINYSSIYGFRACFVYSRIGYWFTMPTLLSSSSSLWPVTPV